MIVGKDGPVFPLRAVLLDAMGFPKTTEEDVPSQAKDFGISDAKAVEDLWRGVEGLTLALALAGYECRQVVVGKAAGGRAVAGYLTLDPSQPGAKFASGDWSAATGVPVGSGSSTAVLVRSVPRRTYGEPSPYPAVSIAGVDGFVPFREPATVDPFTTELDGWIVMTSSSPDEGALDFLSVEAEAMRWQVVDALATAWETGGSSGAAAGLLKTLDAGLWEATHDVTLPITQFRQIGMDIWEYLRGPGVMREFLERPPDDTATTLNGAVLVGSIGLHAASGSLASLHGAMEELSQRQKVLQPRHAALPKSLGRFRRRHWLYGLLLLQEYGLVRTLPFPLPSDVGIPCCDLTGWYETESGVRPIRCLQLNQAADQFDGWWQDEQLTRWGVERAPEEANESGPYGTNPGFVGYKLMFTLLEGDQPSADATIDGVPLEEDPDEDMILDVRFQGEPHRLVRRDRYARLAAEVRLRDAPPESRALGEAMIARLHTDSEMAINTAIGVLVGEIRRIVDAGGSDWNVQIVTLEQRFRESLLANGVYSYTGFDDIVETPMLLRLRAAVRILLPGIPAGDSNAWKQLLEIVAVVDSVDTDSTGLNTVAVIRKLLALPSGMHQYSYQFLGVGPVVEFEVVAGGSGGGMFIGGPITHSDDCPLEALDEEPNWTYIYAGRLRQAGLSGWGVGAKVDVAEVNFTSNDLFASTEWHPDHFARLFPSAAGCVFIQGTFSTGAGVVPELGAAYGYEIVEGYTFLSRLDLSTASGSGTGHFATIGVGGSAEIGGGFDAAVGIVDFRLGGVGDPPRKVPVPETPLVAAAEGLGDACFLVASHELSDVGRKALAHEVARNRALFQCPGSVMLVEGDASPTGPVDFNEQLSWRRAKSVYSWIRSALTSERKESLTQEQSGLPKRACALAIAEGRVQMFGYGEMQARFHGVLDGVESDPWRMAKVSVNNSELLLL